MNYHFLLLALGLGILGYTHAAPPPAPEGYMWVKNAKLTDEFNGTSLDSTKWLDRHPWWKGRAPAKFVPAAVSLNNGKLQIRNHMLSEPDGEYTIGCGAVVSKEPVAFYGYYEVSMKASKSVLSSTFWFSNRSKKVNGASVSHELDVVETVGGAKAPPAWAASWRRTMNSNTHYSHRSNGKKDSPTTPKSVEVDPPVADAYHTYAAWWVDANTVRFYLNDKYVYTLNPSTKYSDKPFDRPMQMNLVTETYDWQPPPPPVI